MKRSLVLFLIMASALQMMASGGAILDIAEDLYSRLAYTRAADYYIRYLEKEPDDVYAWEKLASCYDLTNDYENLEATLADIVKRPELVTADSYLAYAEVLQLLGKYNDAAGYYQKYLDAVPDDRRAQNQLAVCTDAGGLIEQESSARYRIENMDFNTEALEYSPNFFNNTLLYTSTSVEDNTSRLIHPWTGGTYSDLKQYELSETEIFILFNEMEKINTKYNDGPFSVDPITGEFYYTRNNYDPERTFKKKGVNKFNYVNLKIYIAGNDVASLGSIDNMREFPYNSEDYNTGHPTISPDGQYLVFVSDIPDSNSIGGRDLFYCSRDSTGWAAPQVLSADINTEGDELFPYFHESGILYFSSDGLGSLGGLDIFRAEVDLANNEVISVERLEDNINSSYDDFGIVFKDEHNGFFTSDRPEGQGRDDIYSFKDNTLLLKGLVVDAETGEHIPMADFRVSTDKLTILEGLADEKGRFETYVNRGELYNVFADADLYLEDEKQVSTVDRKGNKPLEVVLKLQPVRYTVKVVDAETGMPISGANVDVVFDCDQEPESVVTSRSGAHALPVYKDCLYKLKGKTEGYLAKNIEWKSPKEDGNQEIVIEMDKITFEPIVLRNIYYDFDKSTLRLDESIEDLRKLRSFLLDNPELTIQINSHTDARGSKNYNVGLSQRRAQSVVDWLTARMIPKSRLVAIGYGENSPVNNCVDGVKCSEEEHQLNRRTEFQVINADGSTKIESDVRRDIKTDPCTDCPF